MTHAVMDDTRRPARPARSGAAPRLPARPRRRVPHLLVGVLLVTVCALAVALVVLRAGGRSAVLVMARSVAAGQVVAAEDLRVAHVAAGPDLGVVPANGAAQVVGRTAAIPLAEGSLLSPAQLGPATFPADGQAMIGLALSDGQYPPGLATGARVVVVLTAEPGISDTGVVPIQLGPALVASVQPGGDPTGGTRVGLVLDPADAVAVAGAGAGRVALVALSAAGGAR
ncbi:MAG: SAF domain-containing protein [Sporichthyaceae bacterium]|nr:SAF domain-containing protein [Sporichthyaceae bacterium]